MVTDTTRNRRSNRSPEADGPDRGQIVLIGALALAFIILGVVIVFNGVLYTETLSAADTGQAATDAGTVEHELKQGVSCLLAQKNASSIHDVENEVEGVLADRYANATANSRPAVIGVSVHDEDEIEVRYDSADVSYTRTFEVVDDDCARGVFIESFAVANVTESDGEYEFEYEVDWSVRSGGSDLANVTVSHDDDQETPDVDGTDAEGTTTLESDDDDLPVEISVRNEAGNTAWDTDEPPSDDD